MRFGLNKDLGFSEKDRNENIRRIAEVCILRKSHLNPPQKTIQLLQKRIEMDGEKGKLTQYKQVAKLFADSSTIAITSFISPYKADREQARALHAATSDASEAPLAFVEVYVDIPLEVAEARDPKGLYKKAREGKIPEFTGVSAPYEAPEAPEIHIRSDKKSVEESVVEIVEYLKAKGLLDVVQ